MKKHISVYCVLIVLLLGMFSCRKPDSVEIGPIAGATSICLGENSVQYWVSAAAPVDYIVWTVPQGSTIVSGQGSNSIVVNFGKYPGSICAVLYKDGELVSSKSCLDVSFGVSGTWCREVNFGGGKRSGAIAFSIGNKGYVGTGFDQTSNKFNDLLEYDPETVTWTQKASFAGLPRLAAVAFVINNKGYVGMGYKGFGATPDNFFNDLWEYDPATNLWNVKSPLPGPPRQYAFGFSVGNKGYLGSGQPDLSNLLNDFYEYDPAQDQWTQKANLPFSRVAAVAFSIENKGYAGTGKNAVSPTIFYNDFYEYDPAADQWIQKASFPGAARYGAVGFVIGNKGYIGMGYNTGIAYKDLCEYDPQSDTWSIKAEMTTARRFAVGFSIGNKGYAGIGDNNESEIFDDFWVYTQ